MSRPWYRWEGQALVLDIRVQPRASRDEVAGPSGDRLKIRLQAVPVDGKANQQLLKFLAGVCGVAKSAVKLLSGATSRNKRIRINHPRRLPDGVCRPEV
jgi:uncharacterized protein (TIGR00251 family)